MRFSTNVLGLAAALLAVTAASCTSSPSPNCGQFCPCTADTDCSAPTPRCDSKSGSCVPCLPQKDNCASGQRCVASGSSYACTSTCATSADCASDGGAMATCCRGLCTDVGSDVANCGACATACPVPNNADATCAAGKCLFKCHTLKADCDGKADNGCETDTATSDQNCGVCGMACPMVTHGTSSCSGGTCGKVKCTSGFADCNGQPSDGCETDLTMDPQSCGACGKVCSTANATSTCSGAKCAIVTCTNGFGDCNGMADDGCEVDLSSDALHCGACVTACPVHAHQVNVCASGKCQGAACLMPYADCNKVAADGCEIELDNNPANCGACGNGCPVGPNYTATCAASMCAISCDVGWKDCNGVKDDGCEVHISVDPANCGACGTVCPAADHSRGACSGGACGAGGACDPGWGDCNGNAADGCEHTLLDDFNCGGCGVACAAPNATSNCVAGVCAPLACTPGWGDCDTVRANGCEVDLSNDRANCGRCGAGCPAPFDATATCANAACGFLCDAGWTDCNGVKGDGCETHTDLDAKNCGSCGKVCPPADHSSGGCAAAACGPGGTCDPGWGDCNMTSLDGCEHPLVDNQNCGGCGVACAPANALNAQCNGSGVCEVLSCNKGWGNCDKLNPNGCEVSTDTDPKNCGACGFVCALPHCTDGCAGGKCTIAACDVHHADCNVKDADGCEVDLESDPANCGGCGLVCPNVFPACSKGLCTDHYTPDGVQTSIPVAWLGHWSQCYLGTYDTSFDLATLFMSNCTGANLLLACRPTGSNTLSVLAQAPASDVTFDTDRADNGTTHTKNQVGFYYNGDWSWGFVPDGDTVLKRPCDYDPNEKDPAQRLCWPTAVGQLVSTGPVNGGVPHGRCGAATDLSDAGWERPIYQAD